MQRAARAAGAGAGRATSQATSQAPGGKEILNKLSHSIRCRNVDSAWKHYRQLVAGSRREKYKAGSTSAVDPAGHAFAGVVSSQQRAASARECVREAHQRILEMLNVRHLGSYTAAQLEQLAKGVELFLREAAADSHALSSKQLVGLFNFFAAARSSAAVDSIWQYATLSGVPLDIACHNAYINALAFTGQTARALDAAGTLKTRGLQPTAYTYACLIGLYGQAGDLEAAVRHFRAACLSSGVPAGVGAEARQAGAVQPQPYWHDAISDTRLCGANIHVCNAMLDVYGANGMVQEMRQLFLRLLGLDGYTGGISTISREAARDAVRARGIQPVAQTFHTMIKWHAAYWDLAAAVEYTHLMSRCGVPPTSRTLKLLVTKDTVQRDVAACANVAVLMGAEYNVEVPSNVVRLIETAAQKRAEMDEMVRQSETQHSSILSGLSGLAGGTSGGTLGDERHAGS
ncbi:hypothetical protein IWQ57_001665 [Coemansia nantahalensis]|uniref:Uncharacterized protein n=1 Tax=Coemansia nantahalensis TaxID=2789366 RepID=A0ACC1K363_9FUNG|nr:hypothetical protein IWQ57_001665 [Coemansia nantahalensis]